MKNHHIESYTMDHAKPLQAHFASGKTLFSDGGADSLKNLLTKMICQKHVPEAERRLWWLTFGIDALRLGQRGEFFLPWATTPVPRSHAQSLGNAYLGQSALLLDIDMVEHILKIEMVQHIRIIM